MTRRVNARIRPHTAAKIARLRKATGKTTTEILTQAIDRLHDELVGQDAADALQRFIGCGDADPSLSQTYKSELTKSLGRKHGHR